MDAKLNIHFKRQKDGSVLATAVMTETGAGKPGFYRVKLSPDVDPLAAYNEVAARAISYILGKRADPEGAPGGEGGKKGTLIRFQGALPT
ncbi:hypothetical protein [Pseudodesulfovibrio karagichevae]|uniref:Uncharacterized protein n=1 Tax=Pseudodesulfovibrio karagichevae TaxID=3239305 RepID=A0ABV4JXJ2_9BACT